MILRAAAALPHCDRRSATEELRQQLHVMAVAADVTPDWSTLAVTGPMEVADAVQEARFEWTASVAVHEAATPEGPGRAIAIGSDRPASVPSDDADAGRHLQGLFGG